MKTEKNLSKEGKFFIYKITFIVCSMLTTFIGSPITYARDGCPARFEPRFTFSPAPSARKWTCVHNKKAACYRGYHLIKSPIPPFTWSCKKANKTSKAQCDVGTGFFPLDGRCHGSKSMHCPIGYVAEGKGYWERSNVGSIGKKIGGMNGSAMLCVRVLPSPNKYVSCPSNSKIYLNKYSRSNRGIDTCKSKSNPNIKYPVCSNGGKIVIRKKAVDLCVTVKTASAN